jgi:hypothetical protein
LRARPTVPLLEEAMVSTLSSAMAGMIRRPAPGVKRWIVASGRDRDARGRMRGKGGGR